MTSALEGKHRLHPGGVGLGIFANSLPQGPNDLLVPLERLSR
jgi:hypothetical protein